MRCVTSQEIADWLFVHHIPQDLHHRALEPRYYDRFRPPANQPLLDAFIRKYYATVIPSSSSMIHICDWDTHPPSDMNVVTGLRSQFQENRWLIDAPGHLLHADEAEWGIALFSLSASFGWSATCIARRIARHSTIGKENFLIFGLIVRRR